MFTKTTLFKFALVPLAAATVLSHIASATPASQLEVRGDAPPPPPTPSGGDWSNQTKTDCECAWDKDHVPEIAKPCKETVWHVGDRQNVTWEKKGDDWKHSDEPKKHDGTGTDGKDGYSKDDDKDGYSKDDDKDGDDGKDHDHKRRPCTTRLFHRKGEAKPFLILAEDFDVKAGSVEVTVPNVIRGEDYRVTLFARDDKPGLESCSDKFKIVKDDKHRHKDCKDDCKDDKDDKGCCKDKDGKDGKDGKDSKDGKDGGY